MIKMKRGNKRKRREETKKVVEEEEPRFDDDEPIGAMAEINEQEGEESEVRRSIPPTTTGVDSTKPTMFDRLPWKKVSLPGFIADGLSFDPEAGGLLGLEELDGSVWETIKLSSASSSSDRLLKRGRIESIDQENTLNLDQMDEIHENSPAKKSKKSKSKVTDSTKTETTKTATDSTKTEKTASETDLTSTEPTTKNAVDKELRKMAKKERLAQLRQSKKNEPVIQAKKPKSESNEKEQSQPLDEELMNIDWAACANLDGISDMEGDSEEQIIMKTFNESLLPGWSHIKLANPLKRALHCLSFSKPTPVQDASLPVSLASGSPRDLVVIAETGSGKTLAYALPILNELILSSSSPARTSISDETSSQILPIVSLILTPTRELCLQVKSHIDTFLKAMCTSGEKMEESEDKLAKNRTGITTVSICGGIAIAKQRKQLDRSKKLLEPGRGGLGCIVIATPGRLWDVIQTWDDFAEGIRKKLHWLVIDEADKMIEKGQFEEIEKILKLTRRTPLHQPEDDNDDEQFSEGEDEVEDTHQKESVKEDIRTMVFSATMDKSLQINLKRNAFKKKNFLKGKEEPAGPMQDLLQQIDFRDPQPELIDLSPEGRMVSGLKECKIECVLKDKDLYLYHFLLRYTGRTIVFLSSISALRRLAPIFTLLLPKSKILTLHSEMQQRSRLNSIDRFKSNLNSILLSTDVAARGLDIPQVDHVIHYQVPRTTECYVHRSGRTARAGKPGVAFALIAPDELKIWRNLMKNLGRADNFPSPPIEYSISNKLKELLELAKKIDILEHQSNKKSHEKNWLKKTAEVFEIDLDSNDGSEEEKPNKSKKNKPNENDTNTTNNEAKMLRNELKIKLNDPIILKNNSLIVKPNNNKNSSKNSSLNKDIKKLGHCFIKDFTLVEQFLNNQNHLNLVGLDRNVNAINELS